MRLKPKPPASITLFTLNEGSLSIPELKNGSGSWQYKIQTHNKDTAEKMTEEIPIWVNGVIQWVSGVDRKTTCKDVIEAVLLSEGNDGQNVKDYTIMERWRRVERPLDENSKILKIWSHWGDEKKEVRLWLKKINNDIDSGRGSPVGHGNIFSLKRRRHHRSRGSGKPPWSNQDTIHPKRLAELGELSNKDYEDVRKRQLESFSGKYDDDSDHDCTLYSKIYGRRGDDSVGLRKKPGHRSYQCAGTGVLHSTLLSPDEGDYSKPTTSKCCSKRQSKSKIRNSENIEKLMKLILAQGATIQSQLQKLKEREEQIESLEDERHKERIEKNGRNYLLETYLGSLNEAEIPAMEEGNEEGSTEMIPKTDKVQTPSRISKKTDRPKQTDVLGTETHTNAISRRNKRSRSESRSVEQKCEENEIKRTLSDNDLAENAQDTFEDKDSKSAELQSIQTQMEMWKQVFKINQKLEKEEENLVRLHIKIKRFQMENVKRANDEGTPPEESSIYQDRQVVQKDLENVRKDLDRNSKEIYQNFTKLKENDDVVQQKRTILNRLIDDLHETEEEHSLLSQMVLAEDKDEGRTSFFEEEDCSIRQDTVPRSCDEIVTAATTADPNIDYNQRAENSFRQEESVKPKIVKISFDDQTERTDRGRTSRTIKGILKNRNYTSEQCETNVNNNQGKNDKCAVAGVSADGYPLLSYPMCDSPVYLETRNYFLPSQETHTPKSIYSGERENNSRGSIMATKVNIHNDTDSNTSSDTSGMCSMYSSSPTAEETYSEPTYVLDTLV